MIEVRCIRSGEWERLRDIRLQALRDTPSAFATTFAEAAAYPASVWQERAASGAVGDDQITLVALQGEETVGMTAALCRPGIDRDVVPIISVFVSALARRQGVGGRLIHLAEEWARTRGRSRTSLWVEELNTPARGFYRAIGYVATRDRQPMPLSGAWEIRLEKGLTASG
jgi:GNAT superfamily N-acetyltransferase